MGGALVGSFFVSEFLSSFLAAVVLAAVSCAFFVVVFWPDVAALEASPATGVLPPPDAWEPWSEELSSTMVAAIDDHAGNVCVVVSVL